VRRLRGRLLVLAFLGTASGHLVADAGAQERLRVLTESGTPVIATEILLAAGPLDEPTGKTGVAHLAGRAVVEPIRRGLDSLGARLLVEMHKDAISFTLTAAPDAWEEASRRLVVALFRDAPDSLAVAREQGAIRRELAGRAANPADVATREADAAFFGRRHPWGRSEVGTSESVAALDVRDVDLFLRRAFLPERAVIAVVGPVESDAARRHLLPFLAGQEERVTLRMDPRSPVRLPVRHDYDAITTWVVASFRFPATADLEAVRLTGDMLARALAFGPRQRSIYDVRVEVYPRLVEGELRVQLVVPPGEADFWAGRILQSLDELTSEPLREVQFAQRLRAYRGHRLLGLASPEARAGELARRLLLGMDTGGPLVDFEGLTRERLMEVARELEPPTMVYLGPSVAR
jgi:predicted Zn-dependent peptidase